MPRFVEVDRLPQSSDDGLIYECWVSDDRGSFNKLRSDEKLPLISWLLGNLENHSWPGAHIHIVVHGADEYEGDRYDIHPNPV